MEFRRWEGGGGPNGGCQECPHGPPAVAVSLSSSCIPPNWDACSFHASSAPTRSLIPQTWAKLKTKRVGPLRGRWTLLVFLSPWTSHFGWVPKCCFQDKSFFQELLASWSCSWGCGAHDLFMRRARGRHLETEVETPFPLVLVRTGSSSTTRNSTARPEAKPLSSKYPAPPSADEVVCMFT